MNKTEKIWMEFHDKLLSFIKGRVSNSIIAEDILHDIFLKIHSRIDTLGKQEKMESWIYQITRNAIIDYYRTCKIEKELPDWVESTPINVEEKIRHELSACLASMVNHLPDKYRAAIQISELEGKTQKEVAKKENISLSGAKSRVQRGRKILKTMLQDCCQIEINHKHQVTDFSQKEKDCKFC